MNRLISRRGLLTVGAATAAGTLLSGCDALYEGISMQPALDFGQWLSHKAHRLLLAHQPLVREYTLADISPDFPPNGTEMPAGFGYFEMMISQFANWRLKIDGLVRIRCRCHSRSSRSCPRAPRSPSTIATRAGPRSASGPACRCATFCKWRSLRLRRATSCSTASTR